MSEALSKTLHGDFDSVFYEVTQPEKVAWTTDGQLRLFHLNIRNNKFNPEEMKTLLYRNIGEYVFSRAKIENFKVSGDAFAVGAQAIRVINKNGSADVKGTGAELGEMLLYSFLEEKLKAPKLMSRVELSTDAKQYASTCDGIHLLTSGTSGLPYHQVVFVRPALWETLHMQLMQLLIVFLRLKTMKITNYIWWTMSYLTAC